MKMTVPKPDAKLHKAFTTPSGVKIARDPFSYQQQASPSPRQVEKARRILKKSMPKDILIDEPTTL